MRTLQTELERVKLAKKPKRPKRVRGTKARYSDFDWSEVERELLASQVKDEEVQNA